MVSFTSLKRGLFASLLGAATAHAGVLSLDHVEMAGISGFRPFWNRPIMLAPDGVIDRPSGAPDASPLAVWAPDLLWDPAARTWLQTDERALNPRGFRGPPVFDSVHRSLLVRFPGAAARIAEELNRGMTVSSAHLLLPFIATEREAYGYAPLPDAVDGRWDELEPRWHAVAWALRRPWKSDPRLGPTFNAYIRNHGYWTRFGAGDETADRHPPPFGPAEVSHHTSRALDVTACLTNPAFGTNIAQRLRRLEDCGFLVRKLETWDAAFESPGYDWASMTGGRGIIVGQPRLIVRCEPDKNAEPVGPLPPHSFAPTLARLLSDKDAGGAPTATFPGESDFDAQASLRRLRIPAWADADRWNQLQHLEALGGPSVAYPSTLAAYERRIDRLLAIQPRRWEGDAALDDLFAVLRFQDAWPAPAVEHLRMFWESHLRPDSPQCELVSSLYHQVFTPYRRIGSDYHDRTRDWRGNSTFFRATFSRTIASPHLNQLAAVGALVGGTFIGSPDAMADGRYGYEHFSLRLWSWYDGTSVESIEVSRLGETLAGHKLVRDYGPDAFDRGLALSALVKTVDELAACYHPNLGRFISTTPWRRLDPQASALDGPNYILHTLATAGTLGARDGKSPAAPSFGSHPSPAQVALLSSPSPWAPPWLGGIVNTATLPHQLTARCRDPRRKPEADRWKRVFLGRRYAIASTDLGPPDPNFLAFWNSTGTHASAPALRVLTAAIDLDDTAFANEKAALGPPSQAGSTAVLHQRNKAVLLASPFAQRPAPHNAVAPSRHSLATTLALLAEGTNRTWTVWFDGKPMQGPTATISARTRILIEDSGVFIGIIPLPAPDLGRDAEIEVSTPEFDPDSQSALQPALLIRNLNYRMPIPLAEAITNAATLDSAWGGFVIELADDSEQPDRRAFARHLRKARLDTHWNRDAAGVDLRYKSGRDTFELLYHPAPSNTAYTCADASATFGRRLANGAWPYLPAGMMRETPFSLIGEGSLRLQDRELRAEPSRLAFLIVAPDGNNTLAANPLPDPGEFVLALPRGRRLESDGKAALLFVDVDETLGTVRLDYGPRPGQPTNDMASALLAFGMAEAPCVILNGQSMPAPAAAEFDGETVYVLPLLPETRPDEALTRFVARRAQREVAFAQAGPNRVSLASETPEHIITTAPRPGAWGMQRIEPRGTMFDLRSPDGARVTADGRVAVLRIMASRAEGRVEIDAPLYMQLASTPTLRFDRRARCFVIFGFEDAPAVILNGRRAPGPLAAVALEDQRAWLVPFDGSSREEVLNGLDDRYDSARALLPPAPPCAATNAPPDETGKAQ